MHRFVKSALLISGWLTTATAANAATYKVGPTQQYKQLSAVTSLLKPGDVVEIDGDATYSGGLVFDKAGSQGSKITVRGIAKNGKRPVISGGTNTIEARADHYVFEGLELTGGSSRCFFHHAHDITLRGSVVHDCPKQGVLGADQDSGSMLMEYTEVYNCGGGTFDHQIYMATDEAAHPKSTFRMQNCYVHDANGGNNVKSRAERNEIYYNWIEGALYHELELIGPDGGNPALAREDSDVVGNVLVKDKTSYVVRFGGDGTGETDGRYRFVNNTVIVEPGGSAVFRLFHGIESVEMHNNVFWATGSGNVNVLRTTEAQWTQGSALIAGKNNWVKSGASNTPSQWTNTTTGSAPGFSNAAGFDFHPTMTAAIVDKGAAALSGPSGYPFPSPLAVPAYHPPDRKLMTVGTAVSRPAVAAVDQGAYEYGASTGGVAGSAGAGASAGAAGSAGSASGGVGGGAGSAGTGASSPGGSPGSGGSAGSTSSGGSASGGSGEDDSGCGCRTGRVSPRGSALALSLMALAWVVRRRRGRFA